MAAAPVIDGLNRPSEALPSRLACETPFPRLPSSPVKRVAEEVEGAGTLAAHLVSRWFAKLDEPRLIWMQRQSVSLHSLGQHCHHPLRVISTGKRDHEIVRVSDEHTFA